MQKHKTQIDQLPNGRIDWGRVALAKFKCNICAPHCYCCC